LTAEIAKGQKEKGTSNIIASGGSPPPPLHLSKPVLSLSKEGPWGCSTAEAAEHVGKEKNQKKRKTPSLLHQGGGS